MEAIESAVADAKDAMVKSNRMKGMKIRDEFMCPITYELMREPVVASDGHTYEKSAIEKWLKSHQISPRNGEPISATTISNINLKKLIQDMIDEGGAGLYSSDASNKDRMFEVRPEKVLLFECLGPPESDWNQQSFLVNRFGCIGGRKHSAEDSMQNKELVLFKDITVSRRHFEVTQSGTKGDNRFFIRDLGSAGGTFIRIPHGKRKQLHPGMIILLGKHQFTVSSIDDAAPPSPRHIVCGSTGNNTSHTRPQRSDATRQSLIHLNRSNAAAGMVPGRGSGLRKSGLDPEAIISLVENAEKLISDFSMEANLDNEKNELSERLKSLTLELSARLNEQEIDNDGDAIGDSDAKSSSGSGADYKTNNSNGLLSTQATASSAASLILQQQHHHYPLSQMRTMSTNQLGALHYNPDDTSAATAGAKLEDSGCNSDRNSLCGGNSNEDFKQLDAMNRYSTRRCTLTCCAPDGSPLQGQSFVVDKEGAGLGRKNTNAIPLMMKILMDSGEERVVNVDTAISSEHATVDFDANTGQFFIFDGTTTKASTNGTWFRLSGPHQESPPHELVFGTEVLIGTVRFLVRESMTISEHGLDAKGFTHSFLNAQSSTDHPVTASPGAK